MRQGDSNESERKIERQTSRETSKQEGEGGE